MAEPSNTKKSVGRPRIELTPDEFRKIGRLKPTQAELAVWFECSPGTIENRLKEPEFREALEAGKADTVLGVKRGLVKRAIQDENVPALTFLAKAWGGMNDKEGSIDINIGDGVQVNRLQHTVTIVDPTTQALFEEEKEKVIEHG